MTLKKAPSPYEEIKELREKLEIAKESLNECLGQFLSIKLDYGFEVGNTPKLISTDAIESIQETLKKLGEK